MGMGVEEEKDVLQRRKRKNIEKNNKNDSDILEVTTAYGGETDVNVDDKEVGLRKDSRKRKKKEKKYEASDDLNFTVIEEEFINHKDHGGAMNKKRKLELKKDEERKNDVQLISMKEKNQKKENRTKMEKNNVIVDDNEVGLRKDDRQRKEKEEKKAEASDELDFSVIEEEFINDKGDRGANNLKRKLEHKKDKVQKNDVKLISRKEKNCKKENRNKMEKDKAGDDLGCRVFENKEAPNGKSHVAGDNNINEFLDMSKDEMELSNKLELELMTDKKWKEKRNKNKEAMGSSLTEIFKDKKVGANQENKRLESCKKEEIYNSREGDEGYKVKEKKKVKKEKKKKVRYAESLKMRSSNEESAEGKKSTASYEEVGIEKDQFDIGSVTKVENKKKNKKKGEKYKNDVEDCSKSVLVEKLINERKKIFYDKEVTYSGGRKTKGRGKETLDVAEEKKYKNKRKKANSVEDVEERSIDNGDPRTKNMEEIVGQSGNSKPNGPSRRVKFSGKVEVFPLFDGADVGKESHEKNLVRGKRFSQEEDAMIKCAVLNYVRERGLGDEEGVKMVLRCRSHPEVKNCWKEIASALPWRPYEGIYNRAHVLFERNEKRVWTNEEKELVRKFHKKRGSDWRLLADLLGKHRHHVKDTWRRIKLPNLKKGHWSQDEYQTLFDLVNMDLRMKAFEEKKSKHGMLRDNICWEAISEKLSTRTNATCCYKWYNELASPLVKQGKWADADDYRLLEVLINLDACCVEDVDWDNLLEHRPGDICRKRWNQMVKNIGDHRNKSFAEQVEVLAKRYDPNMLEVREAYDRTPVTP